MLAHKEESLAKYQEMLKEAREVVSFNKHIFSALNVNEGVLLYLRALA